MTLPILTAFQDPSGFLRGPSGIHSGFLGYFSWILGILRDFGDISVGFWVSFDPSGFFRDSFGIFGIFQQDFKIPSIQLGLFQDFSGLLLDFGDIWIEFCVGFDPSGLFLDYFEISKILQLDFGTTKTRKKQVKCSLHHNQIIPGMDKSDHQVLPAGYIPDPSGFRTSSPRTAGQRQLRCTFHQFVNSVHYRQRGFLETGFNPAEWQSFDQPEAIPEMASPPSLASLSTSELCQRDGWFASPWLQLGSLALLALKGVFTMWFQHWPLDGSSVHPVAAIYSAPCESPASHFFLVCFCRPMMKQSQIKRKWWWNRKRRRPRRHAGGRRRLRMVFVSTPIKRERERETVQVIYQRLDSLNNNLSFIHGIMKMDSASRFY